MPQASCEQMRFPEAGASTRALPSRNCVTGEIRVSLEHCPIENRTRTQIVLMHADSPHNNSEKISLICECQRSCASDRGH